MTNVFASIRDISIRFDLKGSTIGRRVLSNNSNKKKSVAHTAKVSPRNSLINSNVKPKLKIHKFKIRSSRVIIIHLGK